MFKMKKFLSVLLVGVLMVSSLSVMDLGVAEAKSYGATATESMKTNVEVVEPSGDAIRDYKNITRALYGGNKTVKLVDGGVYHICGTLDVFSNTILDAGTAKIIEEKRGATMVRQDRNTLQKAKGYNAVNNIIIDGGVWVGTRLFREDAGSKEGYKMGANVFNFIHAKDITIKNATIYNVYNAHIIELTGVCNAKIVNCNLGQYKDENGKWVKGFYKGRINNGAIQLDACYSESNNPKGGYFDGTPCKSVLIENNNIKYVTGIETATNTKKKASGIIIKNNKIKYKYKPFMLNKVKGVKKVKNSVSKYK